MTALVALLLLMVPSTAAPATLDPDRSQVAAALSAWDLAAAQRLVADWPRAPTDPADQCALAEVELQSGAAQAAWVRLGAVGNGHRAGEHCQGVMRRVQAAAELAARANDVLTPHFYLRGADKDEIVVAYAAEVLERAHGALTRLLGWQAEAKSTPRIGLELYPSIGALSAASGLPATAIELSGTVALCKEHRLLVLSPLATVYGYNWADTVAHELTHLVVARQSRGQAPVWLQEGLAKIYESAWRRSPGGYLSCQDRERLRRAARQSELLPLARLHPSIALLPSQEATALAFAEVTSLLGGIRDAVGDPPLAAMLRALGRGRTLAQAWRAPLPPLEASFQSLARRLRAEPTPRGGCADTDLSLEGAGVVFAEKARPATPAAQGEPLSHREESSRRLARLGELLLLHGRPAPAATLYRRALGVASRPQPQLMRTLAEALEPAGEAAQAERLALLTQAVQLAPDHVGGRWALASLLLAEGDCIAARPHLITINRTNPFLPAVHDALASCLQAAGDRQAAAQEHRFARLAAAPRPGESAAALGPGTGP